MKRLSLISILSSSLVAVALIPALNADPVKHRTDVTFSGPTEIPGLVLSPGKYVMKVPDPYTHRFMVGFYNADGTQLLKLVRTVPAYRNVRTGKTVITFEERASGAPPAIHTWFEPAAYDGYEFVYPKAEALNTAQNTSPATSPLVASAAPAPALPQTEPAPAAEPAQPQAEAPVAQAPQAPEEIAQATPPPAPASTQQSTQSQQSQPAQQPQELPKTASVFPLVLEAGAFLILAGLFVRLRA